MTRTGYVTVEHPIEEAEALVKRLSPDGTASMSATECDHVDEARERLATAIRIERQPGGSCCGPEGESMGVPGTEAAA